MRIEEFKAKAEAIREAAETEVKVLGKECAFSNATVKIGDTIQSKHGLKETILVDQVKYAMRDFFERSENPQCVYFGYVLTQKGIPRKDKSRSRICESDILKSK